MPLSTTEEIVAELRAGRMVILVDDEDRENEGDFVMAAEFVTPEAINFMTKYGRGLVCLTLSEERCDFLQLPMMTKKNGTSFGTNFTVSIEAAEGVTTGISAADRAHTVRVAVGKNSSPADLVQPGHIFPLRAVNGGVLMRAGHTEAGCDLAQMAGLSPASVICEIMNDDGSMARLPELLQIAAQHNLKIGAIADLIRYRSETESMIECVGEREVHTAHGPFRMLAFRDKPSGGAHLALVKGELKPELETLVRVHQPLTVLDLLETGATTHSWTMDASLKTLQQAERGVAVLLNCDGSAEQIFSGFAALNAEAPKARARDASRDLRTYGIGAQILKELGVGRMVLLANPRKMPSMTGYGLEVAGYQAAPHDE
ncbi:bifunctional 3,4-dihydroxy-2-butanone-4-phosphate synthase/GTP cyclohydrolase II [Massilia sp. W12]|uniref:bifunctional 3,4-dihydroxy-2-butanone-4-phosphate synthase/GTP cyclohydrolase II n=1 Tax=Massilia sp. W12 TaxID=3126507 RepID=UPI0030D5CCB5